MLWPIVLPLKITFAYLVALIVLAMVAGAIFKRRRMGTRAFAITLGLGCLVYLPFITLTMSRINAQRFGVFRIAAFDQVNDERVERYLPAAATNITIEKSAGGFRAKFSISELDFVEFMDDEWNSQASAALPEWYTSGLQKQANLDAQAINVWFKGLNWPPVKDAAQFQGPHAPNGAGFTIWYSPGSETAYQHAGYW